MRTIRVELETATLGTEYDYLLEGQSLLGRLVMKTFEVYCHGLFRFYCPLTIEGQENIPDCSFVFCSNHNSHLDSGILMVASGRGFQNCAMVAAKDYFFDNPVRKYFLNLIMNLIPIDRTSRFSRQSMLEYLLACKEFTGRGHRSLIIYPEGTRSRTGEIQPFKKGPAMISAEVGLPIVPAYIEGTHAVYPKGKLFMRPGKVRVTIGEPIYPEQFLGDGGREGADKRPYRLLTEELEKRVHTLMNGIRDEKIR